MKNKKKTVNYDAMKCPYCGASVHLRSGDGIYKENSKNVMLYVCSKYPACDAYVRVHEGTNKPVGTLANYKLRAMRNEAHRYLKEIERKGIMKKQEIYQWIAGRISAPLSETHIGYMREYYCGIVIEESKKLLNARRENTQRGKRFV